MKLNDRIEESKRRLLKIEELLAFETQIKCAEYRMRICKDRLTKSIWKAWTKILKEEHKQKFELNS